MQSQRARGSAAIWRGPETASRGTTLSTPKHWFWLSPPVPRFLVSTSPGYGEEAGFPFPPLLDALSSSPWSRRRIWLSPGWAHFSPIEIGRERICALPLCPLCTRPLLPTTQRVSLPVFHLHARNRPGLSNSGRGMSFSACWQADKGSQGRTPGALCRSGVSAERPSPFQPASSQGPESHAALPVSCLSTPQAWLSGSARP